MLAFLLGWRTTAADTDFTLLGSWPESSFTGTPLVLPNGKALISGIHLGIPSLMTVELAGATPFQVLGALPMPSLTPVARARTHAVFSDSGRLFVVDVTDPSHLVPRGMILIPDGPVAVSGTHAYVVRSAFSADAPDGAPALISVVDLSDPEHPRIAKEEPLPPRTAAWYSLSAAACDDGVLCVASSSAPEGGSFKAVLDIFDVHAPAAPRWVGQYKSAAPGTEAATALTMVGRRAYWAPFGNPNPAADRQTTLEVVDLADPTAPRLLGSIRSAGEATSVSVNEPYVYLAREGYSADRSTWRIAVDVVEVADPTAPRRVGGFTGTTFDAAPTVAVQGPLAVVSSAVGLTSYDVSDPGVLRRLESRRGGSGTSQVTVAGNRAFTLAGDTLNVLDLTRPETPGFLGTYKTSGGILIRQVAVAGNYAYLATDSLGVQTLDVTDPAAPRRTGVFRGSSQFATVAVEGTMLAAAGYDGLFLLGLEDPARPALRGSTAVRYPEFREKSVAVSGRHVYVTSADDRDSKTGVMEIFDASDPASPRYEGAYDLPAVPRSVAVSGRLAVIASYLPDASTGSATFADILDISDPANPVRLSGQTIIPGGADIAQVRIVGPYAILGGPRVLDLTDPAQPRQVGELFNLASQATLSGDVLFAAAYGKGLRSYRMSPATLTKSRSIDAAGPAFGLALHGNIAWLAAGSTGLRALDRSQPDPASLLDALPLGDQARDVAVAGDHAFVATGPSGLVIADIRDPAHPQTVAELDTPGDARAVAVSGSIACVADFSEGVQVVDVSDPAVPRALGRLEAPGFPQGLAWLGHHVLVACREAGLHVFDLAEPAQPRRVGSLLVRGALESVAVDGHHAFVADGLEGFLVLDVSDPARPKRLGLAPGDTEARSIAVAGRFAYVADVTRGIRVYDIGDPTRPREVGGTCAVNAFRLAVVGDRLLAAAGPNGLAEFGLFTAPPGLQVLPGSTPGTVGLQVHGSPGGSVVVQRSPDLNLWQDGPAVTLEASPVTVPVPAGNGHEFFRLKRP